MAIHKLKVRDFEQDVLDDFVAMRCEEKVNEQSTLYYFDNKEYILKLVNFRNNDDKNKRSKILKAKLRILSSMREQSNLLVAYPIEAISVNGICVGYIMKTIQNAEGFDDYAVRMKEGSIVDKLNVIISACELVDNLHNYKHTIIIGDCHSDQFAVTPRGVCIFDTDTFGFLKDSIPADHVGKGEYKDPNILDEKGFLLSDYTIETDWYGMAVVALKLLMGNISVYGGKCRNYSRKERQKMKLTFFHPEYVELYGTPTFNVAKFAWISIETQRAFLEILEGTKRYNMSDVFKKQLHDLKLCTKCNKHYSGSRYNCCPMCNLQAKEFFEAFSRQGVIKQGSQSQSNSPPPMPTPATSKSTSTKTASDVVPMANTNVQTVEEAHKQLIKFKTEYEITKRIYINGNHSDEESKRLKSKLMNLDIQIQVARQVYEAKLDAQAKAQSQAQQVQQATQPQQVTQSQSSAAMFTTQTSPNSSQTNTQTFQTSNNVNWLDNCWDFFVDRIYDLGDLLKWLIKNLPFIAGVLTLVFISILSAAFIISGDLESHIITIIVDIIIIAILKGLSNVFEPKKVVAGVGVLGMLLLFGALFNR